MKESILLAAESRDPKEEKANKVRLAGYVPAVAYGHGFEHQVLKIKASEFDKAFARAGETHLIELAVNGQAPAKVVVRDVAREQVKGRVLHVDFFKVNMKEKLTVEVPLHFVGEAKVVKELGGVLAKASDHLEVECLPDNLIDSIEVDLSSLAAFDDTIAIGDLKLPHGVVATHDKDEVLVSVVEQAQQEEAPVVEAAAPAAAEKEKAE